MFANWRIALTSLANARTALRDVHFCVHKPRRPREIPVIAHPVSQEQLAEWRKQHEEQYQKALAKAKELNDALQNLHAKYGPKLGELSTRLGRVVRC